MNRKYRTTHRGIAAYLVTKGYQIEKVEKGQNRNGEERTFIYFNMDVDTGSSIGAEYYEAQEVVRNRMGEARG